jgi:hypothetical protein
MGITHSNDANGWKRLSRQSSLLLLKRQLIEIAALKNDQAIFYVEETAAAQFQRIRPFQDGPFSILENILDPAGHFRPTELTGEHLADGLLSNYRFPDHLVIYGVRRVKGRQFVRVAAVERGHPSFDQFAGFHASIVHDQDCILQSEQISGCESDGFPAFAPGAFVCDSQRTALK